RIGGPYSLRSSESSFKPPNTTVPPSGTDTVVCMETELTTGCWTYCVKSTGCPVPVLSNCGKIGTTTGNWFTCVVARLVSDGVSDIRTNRRSAEITACIVRNTPNGYNCDCGIKVKIPI